MTAYIAYQDRSLPDDSGITLTLQTAAEKQDKGPLSRAPLHQHCFYELLLIMRGCCEFTPGAVHVSLIPGDLLLLPPEQPHAIFLYPGAQLSQCQFEPGVLSSFLAADLQDMVYWNRPQAGAARQRTRALRAFEEQARQSGEPVLLHPDSAGLHGLFHLPHAETDQIAALFSRIAQEQDSRRWGFAQMKALHLQEILLQIRRLQLNQLEASPREASWKESMVNHVLEQIDCDLTQEIDFEYIAREQGITPTYFRAIFKEITGLPPTDYLNRMRILRALALLQTSDAPVAEIGRKVGIYDANYFSRLFKKVTGYPPRYFKAIPAVQCSG